MTDARNVYLQGFTQTRAVDPPRFKKGIFEGKPIQTQGEVTQNLDVKASLPRYRRKSVKENTAHFRLGTVSDNALLDVYPGELVFMEKANYTGPSRFLAGYTAGFTAFNGIQTGQSQKEFENRFKFVGIAKNTVEVSDKLKPNNGVSVLVSGSISTMNNGIHDFHPGDYIAWGLRNVDQEIREDEERHLPRIKALPKDKYVAVLKQLDHHELTEVITNAYHTVFHEFDINDLDMYKQGFNKNLPLEKELGVTLRTADLIKGFGLLTTLYQYGLIDIKAPADPLTVTGYKQYNNTLSKPLSALDNKRIADAATGVPTDVSGTDDDRLLFLAYKLGLLKAKAHQQHLEPDTNTILNVLVRINAGHLTTDAERKYYSLANAFSTESYGTGKRNRTMITDVAKLEKLQLNASAMLSKAYKTSIDSLDSKIVGIATNNSAPGTLVDLYR